MDDTPAARRMAILIAIAVLAALVALVPSDADAQAGGAWSDPNTWPEGSVPSAIDDVIIEPGQTVVLDSAAVARTVQIKSGGELVCGSGTLSLTTESVLVQGTLRCGTTSAPFLGSFTLTLIGLVQNPSDLGMGQKFLGVASGGTLDLHGRPEVSWTQLEGNVAVGSNQITVADDVAWPVGAELIVAAGRDQIHENEVVTIASVAADERTIDLNEALVYPHSGEQSTFSNDNDSWTLDERAEVGLLSRNIVIQGDELSESNGIGGHLMSMPGAQTTVSGVELYRMGQRSTLRRYPFHWHLAGDVAGQYLRNSSIHRSFNRCAVIHGTSYAEVADTVCYDFVGHGFFLEDGVEEHNLFNHDLAIGGRQPKLGEELLASDVMSEVAGNPPASFWLSNPNNTVINSAAAGSEGSGFWYATDTVITGDSAGAHPGFGSPANRPWGTFENNRAHSMRQGFSSCRIGRATPGMTTAGIEIVGLTTYHNVQNLWPCGSKHRFMRAITASSANGMQAPTPMVFEDSTFIAYTSNLPKSNRHLSNARWTGVRVYDQGFHFNRVHFVNYDHANMGAFSNGAGAFQRTMNRVENLTFDNSKYRWHWISPIFDHGRGSDVVHDLDGSYTGTAGTAVVMPGPHLHDQSCSKPAGLEFFGWVCPYRYALWRGQNYTDSGPLTMGRSDGVFKTAQDFTGGSNGLVRSAVPITADYDMIVRYEHGMKHRRVATMLTDAFVGDSLVIEYLDTGELTTVTAGGPEVNSLDALRAATAPAWYRHDHSTFIKYFPSGTDWEATGEATLCFVAAPCMAGTRSVDPPNVSIDAPQDASVVSSGEVVNVSASVVDPSGVAWVGVYVGTDLVAERTSPPWNFPISGLPQGIHALKVVGQGTDGETYTAMQQIAVDPTIASVAMVGSELAPDTIVVRPEGAQTTIDGSIENFAFSPSDNTDHVRLEINGVDQGIVQSLPVTAPIVHGVNRYSLVLQRADGGRIASASRVLYGMDEGVIADFEDGKDARASVSGAGGTFGSVVFAWGSPDPIESRSDGQNDQNYFDVFPDSDGKTDEIQWEMHFPTPQSWALYGSIKVHQRGLPYDLTIVHADGTETILATDLVNTKTVDLPADPALRSSIVALQMTVRDTDVPSGAVRSRISLFSIELANPIETVATLGDVNCDTVVDGNDAQLILDHIVAPAEVVVGCEGFEIGLIEGNSADTNLDGRIDAVDALMIDQCRAGTTHTPLCPP